jgi:hypothetical protein
VHGRIVDQRDHVLRELAHIEAVVDAARRSDGRTGAAEIQAEQSRQEDLPILDGRGSDHVEPSGDEERLARLALDRGSDRRANLILRDRGQATAAAREEDQGYDDGERRRDEDPAGDLSEHVISPAAFAGRLRWASLARREPCEGRAVLPGAEQERAT